MPVDRREVLGREHARPAACIGDGKRGALRHRLDRQHVFFGVGGGRFRTYGAEGADQFAGGDHRDDQKRVDRVTFGEDAASRAHEFGSAGGVDPVQQGGGPVGSHATDDALADREWTRRDDVANERQHVRIGVIGGNRIQDRPVVRYHGERARLADSVGHLFGDHEEQAGQVALARDEIPPKRRHDSCLTR